MSTENEAMKWAAEHIDELAEYEGQYIFIAEGRITARGYNYGESSAHAARQGFPTHDRVKIVDGKPIEVYEFTRDPRIRPEDTSHP